MEGMEYEGGGGGGGGAKYGATVAAGVWNGTVLAMGVVMALETTGFNTGTAVTLDTVTG